jgi:rhodanese-related sulfurtransferase
VVALRNGTMGWTLAGFEPDHGKERRVPVAPPSARAQAWVKSAIDDIATRCGIRHVDIDQVRGWQAEARDRTLYLFDVRDPREYEAGHVAGAVSAPGGQLVQATDLYVGTFHARIVLVDDREVRAVMTASWLVQMGWKDVYVLVAAGTEAGWPETPVLDGGENAEARIELGALADLIARDAATVVDLSLSKDYRKAHIPGAWFAVRSRLDRAVPRIAPHGTLVLTSEDGILARLALDEAAALTDLPVRCLAGGNAAWTASGRSLTADDTRFADDAVDAWLKPYERQAGVKDAMQEYLSWEVDLLERIERDGTTHFRPLVPKGASS